MQKKSKVSLETKPLKVKMIYKKSAITRDRVYRSAIAVMSEKGYQGATIRDICKRADVSPATFYSYYQSKIDILNEIYKEGDSFFTSEVPLRLTGLNCLDQLKVFTSCYAELNVRTGLDIMRVLFNPENEWFTRERPMQMLLLDIVTQGQKDGSLTSALPPEILTEDIFSLLRGGCYSWCVYSASFDLEERLLQQMDCFIHGIRKRPERDIMDTL